MRYKCIGSLKINLLVFYDSVSYCNIVKSPHIYIMSGENKGEKEGKGKEWKLFLLEITSFVMLSSQKIVLACHVEVHHYL